MQLHFLVHTLETEAQAQAVDIMVQDCIIGGWAGRDPDAIEEHIQELAELGVPRPSSVPLYYRVAANQLIQHESMQAVGDQTSGEVEVLVFSHQGRQMVTLASDHTDRKLETHSVALSKQICAKPVAKHAWLFDDVVDHWDHLILRAWINENNETVLYQEGTLGSLLHPTELITGYFAQPTIPDGAVMACGTVAALGGIRPTDRFTMELYDPILERALRHHYTISILPEVA